MIQPFDSLDGNGDQPPVNDINLGTIGAEVFLLRIGNSKAVGQKKFSPDDF